MADVLIKVDENEVDFHIDSSIYSNVRVDRAGEIKFLFKKMFKNQIIKSELLTIPACRVMTEFSSGAAMILASKTSQSLALWTASILQPPVRASKTRFSPISTPLQLKSSKIKNKSLPRQWPKNDLFGNLIS